jgi:hypothetical protein
MNNVFDFFDEDFAKESEEVRQRKKNNKEQYIRFRKLGVEGLQNIRPVWAIGELIDQNTMVWPKPNNDYAHIKVKTNRLIELLDFGELNPEILFSDDKASDIRYVTTLDRWEWCLAVDPPEIGVEKNNGKLNLKISDGRHRAILAYHLGEDCIPIYIHKSDMGDIRRLVEICQE